jgi:uncharacterized protein YndB with AHSA1/START domain
MRVEEAVGIAQPPETVWAVVADPRNDPRWCRTVRSVDVIGERRWRVRHKPIPLRPPRELELKQLEAEPPRRLVLRQEDSAAVFNVEYRLEPSPGWDALYASERVRVEETPLDTSRRVRTGRTPGGKRAASNVKGAPRARCTARRLMPEDARPFCGAWDDLGSAQGRCLSLKRLPLLPRTRSRSRPATGTIPSNRSRLHRRRETRRRHRD